MKYQKLVTEMIKKSLKENSELSKYIPEIVDVLNEAGYEDLSDLVNTNKNNLWKIKKYHKEIISILKEEGYDDLAETFRDISSGIIKYK